METTPDTTQSATEPPSTQPESKAGYTNIPLRSTKHGSVISAALAGSTFDSKVEGRWLVANNSEAQRLVDSIGAHGTAQRKVIYDARLAVATLVMLRQQFPEVSHNKPGITAKLVDGLNAAKTAGKIDDWSVKVKLDGTLTWSWIKNGKDNTGGARDLAAKFAPAAGNSAAVGKTKAASRVENYQASKKAAADAKAAKSEGQPEKVAEARRTRKAPTAGSPPVPASA